MLYKAVFVSRHLRKELPGSLGNTASLRSRPYLSLPLSCSFRNTRCRMQRCHTSALQGLHNVGDGMPRS